MGQQRDQIGHGAAGNEQRGFLAGDIGRQLFQPTDRRIAIAQIVAENGTPHRVAHFFRWQRDRVAT